MCTETKVIARMPGEGRVLGLSPGRMISFGSADNWPLPGKEVRNALPALKTSVGLLSLLP